MDHTLPTHPAPALASPAAALPPPRRASRNRPLGWRCLDVTAIGGPPAARLRVNAVLLHPQHGIALIDLAPRSTPRAAEALRQTLAAAGVRVWPASDIPIAYLCLAPDEMRRLPDLLRAAIAQRAGTPGCPDRTWMAEVAAALAALGRADCAGAAAPGAADRTRWLLPVLLAASLGAGIAAGLQIPRGPAPMTAGDAGPGAAHGLPPEPAASAPDPAATEAAPPPRPADPGGRDRIAAPAAPKQAAARPLDGEAGQPAGGTAAEQGPPPAFSAARGPASQPPAPMPPPGPGTLSRPTPPPAGPEAAAPPPPPRPEPATPVARRPAQPAATPVHAPASPLCAPLLARLQLGERPSDADQALLRTACAPS